VRWRGRKEFRVFRHRFKLDCDWIRDMLEDLAKPFRGSFAVRVLSLVEAELREIDNLLQPIVQAFRRVCSSLENTELAPDSVPALRPALEMKYAAATIAHYMAMCLDFFMGLGISRMAFKLSWGWSFGLGTVFVALAVLSRVVASIFLDRSRPGRYVGLALRFGAIGWFVILLCFVGVYLIRTGALDVGVLGILTPAIWLGFLAQSVAFGALAEVYGYPVRLYHRYRRLVAQRAELDGVRRLLLGHIRSGEGDSGDHARHASPTAAPTSGRLGPRTLSARRKRARMTGAAGMVVLIGLASLASVPVHAGPTPVGSVTRVVLAPDESPNTEDTDEYARVRRALGNGLEQLLGTLPDVEDVEVLHWSDASTVWAAGRAFALPRERHVLPLEASLAPFGYALSARRAGDDARDRSLQVPVVESIRRELMTRPSRPETRSCVTQLILRALESPAGQLWIVASDLQDFQCPSVARYTPGGGRVLILAIPREEGSATRQRLEERMARVRKLFPQVLVIPSWEIESPSSLVNLTEKLGPRPSEGEVGR
jgi:hypothetical protein